MCGDCTKDATNLEILIQKAITNNSQRECGFFSSKKNVCLNSKRPTL